MAWSGWGSGWSWDWSGWGWGGSRQDWTGGSWQQDQRGSAFAGSAGSWQQDQRGSALAGSAGDGDTINPQALRMDEERRELGLDGPWADWDIHAHHRLVAADPEAGADVKDSLGCAHESRRHTQLGKAFQNYRRQTLDKLKKARAVARFFKIWRAVSARRPVAPRPRLE